MATMQDHRVSVAEGGLLCRIELAALSAVARVLRPAAYQGLYTAVGLLAKAFPQTNTVILSDGNGQRKFKIHLNDVFYSRLLDGFVYEEEIEVLLDRVLSPDAIFIDCGANQGYWSVYAALKIKRPDHIVAIEPTCLSFVRLCENLKLNHGSFTPVQKAVYSCSDVDLEFETHPQRHGGNSCVHRRGKPGQPGFQRESAKSTTIDEIVASVAPTQGEVHVVVKLDVEGAEVEALKGARRTIERGGLFIFEEHSKERTCPHTDFLLNQMALSVYLLRLGLEPTRIETVDQLTRLKLRPFCAHNLMAARGDSPVLKRALQSYQGSGRRI